MACDRREARRDSRHERLVRFAKVRLSVLLRLFVDYSFVRSLIFCIFENQGHFRTARSGVYIGLCCMFDYGIRGCRNEINS